MLVPVALPPGVFGVGTAYQAKGRWRTCDHVRWPEGGNLQPVGGYAKRSTSQVTGKCRSVLTWKDNAGTKWIGLPTHSGLYFSTAGGSISDQTPVGFTAGRADATTGGGFGAGVFGAGTFGTPRADSATIQPATVWTQDTWGEDWVGCSPDDGKLYTWARDTAVKATVISGAPTDCDGLSVSEDRFIFAYRGRNVAWCDQENFNDWTASSLNQAGDLDLDTKGTFKRGVRVNGAHLHLTEVDAWKSVYTADVFVHSFTQAGGDCGLIAAGAVATFDGRAAWMGSKGFYLYEGGYVQPIPCEVADAVFTDLNTQQASKISAWHNPERREAWWHFPSEGSTECDRYVFWAYGAAQPYWATGTLDRIAGTGQGVFKYPILVDSSGYVWDHERGWSWGVVPYARSGPLELGTGEQRGQVNGFIPDEGTQGQAEVTFFCKESPNGSEFEEGPFTLSGDQVDCLFSARQVEMQISFTAPADARAGTFRLDVKPVSRR